MSQTASTGPDIARVEGAVERVRAEVRGLTKREVREKLLGLERFVEDAADLGEVVHLALLSAWPILQSDRGYQLWNLVSERIDELWHGPDGLEMLHQGLSAIGQQLVRYVERGELTRPGGLEHAPDFLMASFLVGIARRAVRRRHGELMGRQPEQAAASAD